MKTFLAAWIVFVIASFLLPENATAQELRQLEITPMEPDGPIPVLTNHPDMALVVIRSSLTNLTFESNFSIVEERSDPARGEYMLVLEPVTQSIRVNARGFMSGQIHLRGWSARDVRYYSVEPQPLASDQISVIFNVSPARARLFINGEPTPANETVQLPVGQAEVRIEGEGLRTVQERVEISERNIQYNYTLSPVEQELVRIRTRPAGAEIYLNNAREGRSDGQGVLDLFRFPGSYPVRISADGYLTFETEITVQEEARNEFDFELERNLGTLNLTLNPSDAEVMINRQRVELRNGRVDLAPGMHSLQVSLASHEPYSETIRIERGQTLSRTIRLEPHGGTLQLVTSPSSASVRLLDAEGGEIRRWSGSERVPNLLAGSYQLEVSMQGYDTRSEPLQITRNETTTMRVELRENQVISQTAPTAQRRTPSSDGFQCGDPVTFTYAGEQMTYGTVLGANNRCWLDRNLGASRVARSSTDRRAYGDLFQWGRAADGHQRRNSPTTSTLSSSDQLGNGEFILSNSGANWDWRTTQNSNLWQGVNGMNNPCPSGYRLPTDAEWEDESQSWGSNNSVGAFNSPLKLPVAGGRNGSSGSLDSVGSNGFYWSGTVNGTDSRLLRFISSLATMVSGSRALGVSVRCLKD